VTLHALCAIDALGVGAMCDAASTIASHCAWCRAPVRAETGSNGRQLQTATPASAVVWYTLVFDGCTAQSCCPSTVFFCDEGHLRQWLEASRSGHDGERLSAAEAFEIGVALFGSILREAA
jgi:hypothetical protein